MTTSTATILPPARNTGQSRLTLTIVALVAAAFVLAAVYIYLENGNHTISVPSNTLTSEAKQQYIARMQAVVQAQPAISQEQKQALISAMASQLPK